MGCPEDIEGEEGIRVRDGTAVKGVGVRNAVNERRIKHKTGPSGGWVAEIERVGGGARLRKKRGRTLSLSLSLSICFSISISFSFSHSLSSPPAVCYIDSFCVRAQLCVFSGRSPQPSVSA